MTDKKGDRRGTTEEFGRKRNYRHRLVPIIVCLGSSPMNFSLSRKFGVEQGFLDGVREPHIEEPNM